MEETIGGIAVKLMENKLKFREKAGLGLLVLGSKASGKTTIVNALLEREEPRPKETLGLDYTYGRKSLAGQCGDRSVCGVWEAGGGLLLDEEGLRVPLEGGVTCVLLVLDLGHSLGQLSRALHSYLPLVLRTQLPLYLVGGKYDLYKRAEAGHRAKVSRLLRASALLAKCGLFMFSNQEPSLIKRAKDILGQLAFGAAGSKVSMKTQVGDVDKPLQVSAGGNDDSWSALRCAAPLDWSSILENFGETPYTREEVAPTPDPSLDAAFREPLVDSLRSKKDYQLQLLLTSRGHGDFL